MPENQGKSEVTRREEATLAWWEEREIFKKSLEKTAPNGEYIFYDGPPFATGLPHYGHIVASVIKDVVPRFWTMRGYRCPRVWGWDCHGLPIENIVEKELGFKHKKDIEAMGVAKFNDLCRSKVLTYVDEWKKIIPRIGRWADMDKPYFTMNRDFMESVWWVFKQLWDKGLVYEDYRSMHICPRCETTLSQQEVSEGYKDVKDIAVTVKFKLKNPEKIGLSGDVYLLAWTTTPWTLPGNVALAVGESIEYGVWSMEGKKYLGAQSCSKTLEFGSTDRIYRGSELVGLEYQPPFDYYISDKDLENRENGWKVCAAHFVTAEEGTGIAHEAPAFGADDWELLKKVNLPFVQHVNGDGTMKSEVTEFAGMEVKPRSDDDKVRLGTDIAVLKYLQEHGLLFSKENITHPYPHCWRCDTPLLNYATSSWFVRIESRKDSILKSARPINWSPEHIKEGRWGKWLEGARDWSISRQRFWASVMPVWRCEKCKNVKVFGDVSELEEISGRKIDDLHKHIVDEIVFSCWECEGEMRRVSDVLDTWFDSGSMPYGERHYPFENKEQFDKVFPAQFIAEGLDQTRAWFYYMHVLAVSIFGRNAFQNVIVNGIVLAEDGKKMSKKLKNYPDPMDIVEKYGADALRFYLMASPVVQAENLSFSEKGVDDVAKKNIGRLTNVLAFYELYKDPTPRGTESTHVLDRWILARLDELIGEVGKELEGYRLDTATRPIGDFIDDLSTWYLRRSRERLKEDSRDKTAALATLRHVLYTLSLVMAPSMPFMAEHVFRAVREERDPESVHLSDWPTERETGFLAKFFSRKDTTLEKMQRTRQVVSKALEARDAAKIKVRQPLRRLTVNSEQLTDEYLKLVKEEVNVKEIVVGEKLELDTALTDELREEGILRDTIRLVQDARKVAHLKPGERGQVSITIQADYRTVIEKNLDAIQKQTNADVVVSSKLEARS